MNILKWFDNLLARIEGWLIVLMLWLMVLLTFVQVGLRSLYTYGHLHWANAMLGHMDGSGPFVRLLVLWLTFLGASLLTRDGKHINIDIFSSVLPKRWLPAREVLLASVCLFISAVMFKVCVDYIRMEMAFGGTTLFDLPALLGQVILPAGFAILCFRFLIKSLQEGIRAFRGVP
jgi:TRAP-type C4-dicarboxylate transport system permease small subunit